MGQPPLYLSLLTHHHPPFPWNQPQAEAEEEEEEEEEEEFQLLVPPVEEEQVRIVCLKILI